MVQKFFASVLALVFVQSTAFADVPGGNIRDAEGLIPRTFEVVMSPSVIFAQGGMYLNTELRYQPVEDVGVGAAFGAGELGYNIGAYGTWYALPDISSQPAVAVLGGMYFNRISGEDYFVLRFSPIVSKHLATRWGGLTPFLSGQISPAFSFGTAPNLFASRISMGSLVVVNSFGGLRLWGEVGVGLTNSYNSLSFGVSYPFSSFGE